MNAVEAAAAVAVALVLSVAAWAKVRHRAATISSFRRLRLPAPAVLATAVPVAEAAVAAALVLAPGPAAWAALALLAAFTIVLGRAVLAGVEAPCACFGSARREPVSSVDLVRNVLLIALAVVATGARSVGDADLPGALLVAGAVALGRLGLAALDSRRRRHAGAARPFAT